MLPSPEIPRERPATPEKSPLLKYPDLVLGRSKTVIAPGEVKKLVGTLTKEQRENLSKLVDLHLTQLQERTGKTVRAEELATAAQNTPALDGMA